MKIKTVLSKVVLLTIITFYASFIFAQGHKTIQVTNTKGASVELLSKSYQDLHLRSSLSAINVNPVNTPAGAFTNIFCEDHIYNFKDYGRPHLPVRSELIEIPVGAEWHINILSYDEQMIYLNDYGVIDPLAPAQPSVSKSDNNPVFQYDAAYYQTDNFNVDEMVTVNELSTMRGVRLGQIIISPFRYNPASNTLLVYYNIEFEVVFDHPDIAQTIALKKENYSPLFDNAFGNLINYENEATKDVITTWPITYLVVCPNTLITTLQPFVDWKTKKGFKVVIGNTSTIGTTTTAIKTWIQNQYNTLSPKPTFVLLVGDVAQIPTYSGTGGSGGHPADVYYCTFDGSSDYIPELYIGRMSAETTGELSVIIGKTLMHEQYTWPNEAFLDKCVMVAGVDATFAASHGNGQIYYGIDNYFTLGNGYSNVYAYLYGTSSHPYQVMSSNSSGASADIRAKISAGVGFANYTAHCSEPGWADPSFTTSNIAALTNVSMYPVMIGNCCLSAKINSSPDCFAEQMVYVAEKGAVEYIGASNNSLWDEDFYWGVGLNSIAITSANAQNHTYANTGRGSYDGVWHTHSEPYAQWFVTAREMTHCGNLAVESSTSSNKKYYWEIYHNIGDPSLMAYLSIPTALTVTHGDIAVGATSFVVNTESYAYVALSQNGVLLDAEYSAAGTSVTLTFPAFTAPGTADLVVTKQNRKPDIGTVNIVGTVLAPVADFSGTPTTVYTGNSVQFSDLSTNTPTSWTWTFTGGTPNSATTQNPLVVYNTVGTYAVSLTATNTAGSDTETKTAYITVLANTNPPVADFSASATSIIMGGSVNFTDLSTNTPTSWAWTFTGGTPNVSTAQNPTGILYSTAGTYTVSLTATNAYGNDTETKTSYITVLGATYCDAASDDANYEYISNVAFSNINNASAASTYTDFTAQIANATIGTSYPFTVTLSSSYTTDQVLIWIDWNQDGDFVDAGESVFTSATGQGPFTGSITPPTGATIGSTRMRVRLHDTNPTYSPNATPCGNSGYGEVEDYSVNVISNTAPPIASFAVNVTSTCSGVVNFTDMSTGAPTSWSWDFGDGQTSTDQNPTHTYTADGTYTVELTATNAYGNDTDTQTDLITVSLPAAPTTTGASRCGTGTVDLTAAGNPTLEWFDVATGGTVLGTGTTFTTPSLTTTTTYYVQSNTSSQQQVGHTASTTNGGINSAASYLIFDALQDITILSVEVNNTGAAGNKTISLMNSAGTTLDTRTINVPAGVSRITLDLNVSAGTGYRLAGPANSNLWRNNAGVVYPYTTTGFVSITGSSGGAVYYYYFYKWYVVPQNPCISQRVPVTATIETAGAASITIATGNTTICSGESVTFTSTIVNGGTTPSYQWLVNGSNAGTNSSSFTTTTLNNGDVVSCQLTSSSTCVTVNPVISNTIAMTVNTALDPQISVTATTTMPVCEGNTINFSSTITDGGATPSYQWYVNGTAAGTNSPTYSSVLTDGDAVTCELTVAETCTQNQSVVSNSVDVLTTVPAPPTTTGASNCGAGSVTLSASGTGILEWFDVPTGGTTINTGTSYTTPVLSSTTTYYVQSSDAAQQTVGNTQSSINGGGSTTAGYLIFTAIQDLTILSVEVNNTGAAGNKVISLQNSAGTTLDSRTINVPTGISRITLDFDVVAGIDYRLYAPANTNFYRNTSGFAFPYTAAGLISITGSSNATRYYYFYSWYVVAQSQCVSARTPVTATIDTPGAASITISTPSTDICSGTPVTFTSTIVNGGSAPSYQWYLNGSAVGTNSPSYSTPSIGNDDIVNCELTSNNSCVTVNPVTSNTITMIVTTTIDPEITVIAVTTMPVCSGTQIDFSAIGTDVGTTPSYQWYVNGAAAGTNSSTFSSTTLVNGDEVYCELTVAETCTQNQSVTSNPVAILTTPSLTPTITISTGSSSICPGDMATFSSAITGGGTSPAYQWQVNGSNVGTSSGYSSSALSDGDEVTCILTSNYICAIPNTVSSNSVSMTVSSSLTLTASIDGPSSLCVGETGTYNCITTNAGSTPVYQWQLNGVNTGTNSPSYTNSSLQNDDQITCTVYSSLTCATNSPVTSSPIDIIITPQTALDATISGDIYLCTSETATFTANIIEDGTSPVYDWLVNGVSQGVNSTTFQSSSLNNDDVVSFVITSPGSCISNSPAEFTITVYVDDAPVADFTYVPDGLTFTFTSVSPTGNHLWQFGDGNESSDVNPVYTYAAAGMYIITHYVSNYCDTISVMQSVNAIDVNAEMTETNMLINIFPNPVQGTLNINTSSSFAGKAEFTDISGRIVFVKDLQYDIRHSIDMKQIESGIYFLNLYDLNGNQAGPSVKIIKH